MSRISLAIYQAMAREQSPDARLNWLEMAADRAAQIGNRILVCPELYVSGYLAGNAPGTHAAPIDGHYAERVADIARLHDIAIVFGYPERYGGALYNSAAFIAPDGALIGHHRKNHLPSGYERQHFTADDSIHVFEFEGWKIAILICYDIEFPEAARQAALMGAELLLVPTALGAEWRFVAERLVPTRAWENGVYLAYVNWAGQEQHISYLGRSRVIGPDGHEESLAGAREEVRTAVLDKERIRAAREKLPYLQDFIPYDDGAQG